MDFSIDIWDWQDSNKVPLTGLTVRLVLPDGAWGDPSALELHEDPVGSGHYVVENVTEEQKGSREVWHDGGDVGADSWLRVIVGRVDEDSIKDDAVTENKIADGAITENKIADAAITEDKIEDAAVTESKIADAAITEDKIEDGAITEDKLDSDAVNTANVIDSAITKDKLDWGWATGKVPIISGTLSDGDIIIANQVVTDIYLSGESQNTAFNKSFGVDFGDIPAIGSALAASAIVKTNLSSELITETENDAFNKSFGVDFGDIPAIGSALAASAIVKTNLSSELITETENDAFNKSFGVDFGDIPAIGSALAASAIVKTNLSSELITETENDAFNKSFGVDFGDIPAIGSALAASAIVKTNLSSELITETENDAFNKSFGVDPDDIPAIGSALADLSNIVTDSNGKLSTEKKGIVSAESGGGSSSFQIRGEVITRNTPMSVSSFLVGFSVTGTVKFIGYAIKVNDDVFNQSDIKVEYTDNSILIQDGGGWFDGEEGEGQEHFFDPNANSPVVVTSADLQVSISGGAFNGSGNITVVFYYAKMLGI